MKKTMRFFHIIKDEKFVDDLIHNYELLCPERNRYIITLFNKKRETRFIRDKNKIELVHYKSLISYLKKIVDSDTILFIHGVDRIKLRIIDFFGDDHKIVVHFWGADTYLLPKFSNKLLQTKTRDIFKIQASIFSRLKENYRGYYYHFRYKKSFKKVSYYSTVIPTEKKYLEEYLPNAKHFHFNYADIESLQLKEFKTKKDATNVLIGNSSSYTSNHIDVFNKIEDIEVFKGVKMIIPLNYGNVKYAIEVTEYVKNTKIQNVITLTDFLPPNEYVRILSNCSVAIMNHQRQQAVGTILICLWLGMRVFLSDNNPVYNYYKEKGIMLFSIERELNDLKRCDLLSADEIESNRAILDSIYSKRKSLNNIRELINLISNE